EGRAALVVVAVCAAAVAPRGIEAAVARPREGPEIGALRPANDSRCEVPRDADDLRALRIGGRRADRLGQTEPCAQPQHGEPRSQDHGLTPRSPAAIGAKFWILR